ncbi:MAG: alkaline phosphatase PhoX [Pseudomonadota bacterium]
MTRLSQALPQPHRRQVLGSTAAAFAGLVASGCSTAGSSTASVAPASAQGTSRRAPSPAQTSPLVPDPNGLLDLQEGFSYRILSRLGDAMDDDLTVPDRADGMGSFDLGPSGQSGDIALVRNHELSPGQGSGGDLPEGYARDGDGSVLPGGTTTLVLDAETLAVKRQFRSSAGTVRNCSGGVTPWGTWLTCEEPGSQMGKLADHGFVFEVPAGAGSLVDVKPIKPMGRFNHEAACVDPATGIVYMSEDRDDGLLYRYVPRTPGNLAAGGRLQALALTAGITDSRNWNTANIEQGKAYTARWIDMGNPEAPADDLRKRGAAAGALVIARGEGIHMGLSENGAEFYLCSTSGGAARVGQIFRVRPGAAGAADTLELFFESESTAQFHYGDNLTVAPFGDLIVCEDQSGDGNENRLIGVTPAGEPYVFGRLRLATELAGGCFSPDGKWFFVNAYSPSTTLAITGPWRA